MQIVYKEPGEVIILKNIEEIGNVFLYADVFHYGNDAPRDQWLVCDGSNLPIGPVDFNGVTPVCMPCFNLRTYRVEWLPLIAVVKVLPFKVTVPGTPSPPMPFVPPPEVAPPPHPMIPPAGP